MNLFYILLFSFLFSQDLTCAIRAKNSINNIAKNTQIFTQKNASIDPQEKVIIDEIKLLLKDGKVPKLSFNQWVDTNAPVLLKSDKEAVSKLGQTLQDIRQGKTANVSAFEVLPSFDKAVQTYDPQFKRSILSTPGLIAKGTYWYFKNKSS